MSGTKDLEGKLSQIDINASLDNAETLSEGALVSLMQRTDNASYLDMSYHSTKEVLGGTEEMQAIETASVQRHGNRGIIKAGKRNDLYQRLANLKSKCGLLNRVESYLISTFYTDFGFRVNGVDISQKDEHGNYLPEHKDLHEELTEIFDDVGMNKTFKKEFGYDVFLNGYASPEISFSNKSGDQKPNHVKITKSRKVRLCKLRSISSRGGSAMYPQEVLVSNNNWKDSRKTSLFPIVGSSKRGYGYRWCKREGNKWVFSVESYIEQKNEEGNKKTTSGYTNTVDFNEKHNGNGVLGLVGYYIAMIPDGILEYLPYPYWGNNSTFDTLWSYAQMAAIKAGFMKRSLFKTNIIVINRKKAAKPEDERRLKALEKDKIRSESGAENAGGAIIMWEHSGKDDPDYMKFYEVPQITNHQFLKYLDDGYDRQGAFELGVDKELLNLIESPSGFSNKAQTLLVKFLAMKGDVGETICDPLISFANFMAGQLGLGEVEVYLQEPVILQSLRTQIKKESKSSEIGTSASEITERATENIRAEVTATVRNSIANMQSALREIIREEIKS